ncbi:hypothetical protein K3179_03220 [Qipengyuania sp. GH38]|uniref:hypothetical protein n=1 Tax=Qipengyuania intermedia TaxID=2867244 RepID=UPI001C886788|nr:hypothetical protein [Qipengyuania intermedia]MBX7513551.1 hypothetical protein [Qipengyuania intermedia]
MASKADRLPVIIGVGQVVDRWDGSDPSQAPHPVEMIRAAISRALGDTGSEVIADAVDLALFIRTFPDSLGQPVTPFGTIKNLPRAVLQGTELSPERAIYSVVGGDQPQAMVNELSASLFAGECEVALIAGGEVTGAMKAAMRAGHALDWSDDTDGPVEDRGKGEPLLSRYEFTNGLGMPPQNYAAQEQAWRARKGFSTEEWRKNASRLFARFSEIAAANPYAQFPQALSEEFLSTPSKANYPMCDPLLKWHVAQDAVNQSAALVLTTAGKARELGVAEDKWVYLHGHADVKDALMTQRPDLSHSDAIRLALETALDASDLSADRIAHFDLYSCFPIVPILAAEYLGVDPIDRDLTVTGGLPFFGGPGNNYSTHAIASMVERLRADRGSYGLVLANGGFTSKESVGVYSTSAPNEWEPLSSDACHQAIESRPEVILLDEDCEAEVEAFTLIHGRDGPASAFIIARNARGRVVARVDLAEVGADRFETLSEDLVGRTVSIAHRDGVNFATL